MIQKAWPIFKKLFIMFAKEIVEFIFTFIKNEFLKYQDAKHQEKTDVYNKNVKKAEQTKDESERERLIEENEKLRRDMDNLKTYMNDIEKILSDVQVKATKTVEDKIKKSNIDELVEGDKKEEKINIKEKENYLRLNRTSDNDKVS